MSPVGRAALAVALLMGCGSSGADEQQARQLGEQGYGIEQQSFGRTRFEPSRSPREDRAYREALALYQQSVELAPGLQTPDQGNNLEAVGRMHLLLGEYEQAALWFEQASEANSAPKYACPYIALGNVYRRLGNPDQASASLEEALSRQPRRIESRFLLAQFHLEVGEPQRALEQLDAALALLDEPADAHDTAPDLERQHLLVVEGFAFLLLERPEEAQRCFDEATQLAGPTTASLAGLGHLALGRRDTVEAQRLFDQAAQQRREHLINGYTNLAYLDFERDMVLLGQAWLASNQGQHEQAVARYELLLETRPTHALGLTGLGNSLSWLERYDEAQLAHERLLELDPDNQYALAGLGIVALNRGEHDRAEQLLTQAAQGPDAGYSCPHEGLGLLYLRTQRPAKARRSFQTAIELEPDNDFRKYNGLARLFIDEGDLAGAARLVAKSLSNHPDNAEALVMRAELMGHGVSLPDLGAPETEP
jgi:tetratricopeptide (TPR) repeat protein